MPYNPMERLRAYLGTAHAVDLAVFRRVAASDPAWAQKTLPRISRAADRSMLWLGIAAGLWVTRGRFARRAALRGVVSLGLTSALVNLPVKAIFRRRRPGIDVVPQVRRLRRLPTSRSFPSGHSASAFAFATGASLEVPWLVLGLGPLAAGVAASRVYVGVHYPGDVAIGALIGTAMGIGSLRWWPRARPQLPHLKEANRSGMKPLPTGKGLVLAVNKTAGSATTDSLSEDLAEALPDARIIEVAADDPDELRRALDAGADEADVLGVAGGDGSANCAAQVAVDAGRPLLLVPAGTFNHLARDLGIDDSKAAVQAAGGGRTITMDVATIDGRVFVNTASFGSYVELVDARERLERTLGKWPALLVAAVKVLKTAEPLELELDGRPTRVWMAFIGNCRFQPDGFAPSWRESLDDGYLDVRLVDASRPLSRTRLILSVLTGTVARSRILRQMLVKQLTIRADEPLRLARDGETFTASSTEVIVEKHDSKLHVLVPPR
ncbi:MAG TPA: phosphatase PAP2 family protein [Actinomycetota bacterium]|nr:phosphatase PAP2 family protein [Actinomycetota bacterium]